MKRKRAGRLAWLGRSPYEAEVAGSSPARPTEDLSCFLEKRLKLKFSSGARVHHGYSTGYSTVDWQAFRRWLLREYEVRTAQVRFRYAKSLAIAREDVAEFRLKWTKIVFC